MHVFVVPSWYPHPAEPTDGVFVEEQAHALAELRPDWRVSVGLWGQGALSVPRTRPWQLPGFALRVVRERGATRMQPLSNLVEYRHPRVTWSPRLRDGRWRAALSSVGHALALATAEAGPPDVIHAHVGFPGGAIARTLSDAHGIPYLVTEHMSPFPLPALLRDGALHPELRRALAGAGATIAVSAALADAVAAWDLPRPQVVPNLVDERLFTLGRAHASGPVVFLAVGRVGPQKGFDVLVEALGRLAPEVRSGVRLRLAGGGDPRALLAQAERLGVSDHIVWLGQLGRAETAAEMRSCDCFVLPSRHESFGIVVAEALASGRPVVATRSGGPEELVTEENGILVPPADPAALADALAQMTQAARSYDPEALRTACLARFSRARVVDELERIYASVVL
jgi:glycosyltransferase involved in cell wall biosynthesis